MQNTCIVCKKVLHLYHTDKGKQLNNNIMENLNEIQPKDLTEDQIFQLKMDVIINTESCTGIALEVFENDLVFYCEHMHQAEEIKKYRNNENGVIMDGEYTLTYKELN